MDFTARFHRQLREDETTGRWRGNSFEYELDARLRQSALAWACENPAAAAQLAVRKLVRLWNVWPNDEQFRSVPLRLIVAATFLPCLVWAIIRLPYLWRSGWPAWLCVLPAIYVTLLHVVFVSSIRYREPAMFGLIVLGATSVCLLGRNQEEPRGPRGIAGDAQLS
jgi:hypothetical protein